MTVLGFRFNKFLVYMKICFWLGIYIKFPFGIKFMIHKIYRQTKKWLSGNCWASSFPWGVLVAWCKGTKFWMPIFFASVTFPRIHAYTWNKNTKGSYSMFPMAIGKIFEIHSHNISDGVVYYDRDKILVSLQRAQYMWYLNIN